MTQFEPSQPIRQLGEEQTDRYKRRDAVAAAELERRAGRSQKESLIRRVLSRLRMGR
jgi:hypothetical protein